MREPTSAPGEPLPPPAAHACLPPAALSKRRSPLFLSVLRACAAGASHAPRFLLPGEAPPDVAGPMDNVLEMIHAAQALEGDELDAASEALGAPAVPS